MPKARLACPQCGAAIRRKARFCVACGALVAGAPAIGPLREGFLLNGRYRIEERLGQGGFGEVYRAADLQLEGRPCVVKRLAVSSDWSSELQALARDLFRREVGLLVQANTRGHPHIPEIYDHLPAEQCIVMKYIAGRSLEQIIRTAPNGVPEAVALAYIRPICDALVYLHERPGGPVLHLDVSPANILVDDDERPWLIDFGIAEAAGTADQARDGPAFGKEGYTPPEQSSGRAEPRSDVYALAATLAVLLTGRRAVALRSAYSVARIGSAPAQLVANPVPNGDPADPLDDGQATTPRPDYRPVSRTSGVVAHDLAELLRRCLSHDVALRPSARELRSALDNLLVARELPEPPELERPPQPRPLVDRAGVTAGLVAQLRQQGFALLVGEPGVGKSSVAAAVAADWGDPERVFWHSARPGEGVERLVYMLAAFLVRRGAPGPWRSVYASSKVGGGDNPDFVVLDHVVQALRGLGLLLVLDDFQAFAGAPRSETLLAGLLRAAQMQQVALLLVSRERPPALAEAGSSLLLRGVSLAASSAILAEYGVSLDEAWHRELYRRTEGNPQLLRFAAEALSRAERPAQLIEGLIECEAIEHYLLHEVDGLLGEPERQVMRAMAALRGRPASRAVIEVLAPSPSLRRLLSDLARRSLLAIAGEGPERTYRAHAMLQTFYYEQLADAERRRLHQAASGYYERGEFWLAAAEHALFGGTAERGQALALAHVTTIVNSGEARGLFDLLGKLVGLVADDDRCLELWLARGELATFLREAELALLAFRAAETRLDRRPPAEQQPERVRLCLGFGELLESSEPEEAQIWLRRGLALVVGRDPVAEGRLLAGLGAVLLAVGQFEDAYTNLNRALALLPPELVGWRAQCQIALSGVYGRRGEAANALASAELALALHEQAGNLLGMVGALQNIALSHELNGDSEAADSAYKRAIAMAEELGSVVHQVELANNYATLLAAEAAGDEALALLDHGMALARQHNLGVQLIYLGASRAEVMLRLGRDVEARADALQAWRQVRRLKMVAQRAELARMLAELRLSRGHLRVARLHAERAVAAARAEGDQGGVSAGEALLARCGGPR